MKHALDGVLVVELGQAVAAPFCGTRLAEAGARVIKVERPSGDFARGYDVHLGGTSAFFAWLNRGKESLTLDIKDPADAALLHRIVDRADVFIQNLAPGAAQRSGFGWEQLRGRNPRLITCDISGYGEDNDYEQMKAYDLLVQAESGVAAISGSPEEPGRCGLSVCDLTCGTNAFAGILQALYERQRTGVGAALRVSLFGSMTEWMTMFLSVHELTGTAPPRTGFSHSLIAPYGAFAIGDGSHLVIAVQNEREWQRFCEVVLQRPEMAGEEAYQDNSARIANRERLSAAIEAVFAPLNRETVAARLREGDIAFGSLNEVSDLPEHPALERLSAATPAGPYEMVAPALGCRGETATAGRVPALGEHSEQLRREFAA